MTELVIGKVGLLATVQDLGRPGLAHLGVPTAGAVDRPALRAANRLVGNTDNTAAIEIAVRGLELTCEGRAHISVVGAAFTVDGEHADSGEIRHVGAGAVITVDSPVGTYAYFAIAGGLEVPPVLGSRSADTLSGLGPASLRPGDRLPIGFSLSPMPRSLPPTNSGGALRTVIGPRSDWFADESLDRLFSTEWTVTPSSNRTGLRLHGPSLLRARTDELPSEGVVAGAIQVPPDGQPIVFLANHPTTGGYPVIAVVVSDDVGRAAQHRPGMLIRFSR
jgi:biotin-dependent carboxylase-like uncharacterized protein